MAIPVATIDPTGLSIPLYSEVLIYLQEQYRLIYGLDVDLDADTQDGQWVAILAAAIHDTNQTIAATYQAYSPSFAQGTGLSSVVKINGIRRLIASNSTVALRCVGQTGVQIGNSIVTDALNLDTRWQLPADVTIPDVGEITVTATCLTAGAIPANVETITEISTPVPGWQTVENLEPAIPGLPVENDATLRRRQTQSTANPSQTVLDGIWGAIEDLTGVARVIVYENPTSATDANGLPPYSMAAVVQGGDEQEIANAIALRKTPGSPTYGTTRITVFDSRGIPSWINFFKLTLVPISVHIQIQAFPNFTGAISDAITANVVAYLTTLPIGYDSYYSKLIAATQLADPDGLSYDVTQVTQSRDGGPLAQADVAVTYIEAVTCLPALVTIQIL